MKRAATSVIGRFRGSCGELDWASLVEGDLAFSGLPVQALTEAQFNRAMSCARERHQAINWLSGGEEIYSQTDTST